jgi:hypothetical protein
LTRRPGRARGVARSARAFGNPSVYEFLTQVPDHKRAAHGGIGRCSGTSVSGFRTTINGSAAAASGRGFARDAKGRGWSLSRLEGRDDPAGRAQTGRRLSRARPLRIRERAGPRAARSRSSVYRLLPARRAAGRPFPLRRTARRKPLSGPAPGILLPACGPRTAPRPRRGRASGADPAKRPKLSRGGAIWRMK